MLTGMKGMKGMAEAFKTIKALDQESQPLFASVISRAGNTDPGRFIKTILWVEDRRRAQMQGAGHSIAEVTGLALGVIRFIITDVANPGESFHIVAAAYAFSCVKFLILKLAGIMHLLEDKGKKLRSKKGIVVNDYAFGFCYRLRFSVVT
jgi:hypothetical protein